MPDGYLDVAEKVLRAARVPLRCREIVERGHSAGLFAPHLHGARQDRTLQARLSEDIARNAERSRFLRTGPGTFFLKVLFRAGGVPATVRDAYLAKPRRKELQRERILCAQLDVDAVVRGDQESVPLSRLTDSLRAGRYAYVAQGRPDLGSGLIPVHSFVVVHRGNRVLSFRCGKFFPSTDPLYGRRSVGLGGAVRAEDRDMLYESMFGIVANGIAELGYGLGLPKALAEKARYGNELRPFTGVLVGRRKAGASALHVVMTYRCPEGFSPSKASMSVNDLRWIDLLSPLNSYDDYDTTSKFLFGQDYLRDLVLGHAGP
jgi:hypothetical protein